MRHMPRAVRITNGAVSTPQKCISPQSGTCRMRVVLKFCIGLLLALSGGALAHAQNAEPLRGPIADPERIIPEPALKPMQFRLGRRADSPSCGQDCAEFIVAEGDIRPDSVDALIVLWTRLKRPLPVYLHSPGGSLEGGLALGQAIRAAGMPTLVARLLPQPCTSSGGCTPADQRAGITVYSATPHPGICNSSCVYTFAGGTTRSVEAGSSLGIHQFFIALAGDKARKPKTSYSREDFSHMQRTVAAVAAYLSAMNVSVEVLSLAAEIDPATVRRLTVKEMADLKLTTEARAPAALAARLPLAVPATASKVTAVAPAQSGWPVVTRDGQPFLVLSVPSTSRRFGDIANEMAIGCAAESERYIAAFREIVPTRPGSAQDASVLIGPQLRGEKLAPSGKISRSTALEADRTGVLELEVTSSATAGYPMRLEFPGEGLKQGIERLDRACKGR